MQYVHSSAVVKNSVSKATWLGNAISFKKIFVVSAERWNIIQLFQVCPTVDAFLTLEFVTLKFNSIIPATNINVPIIM